MSTPTNWAMITALGTPAFTVLGIVIKAVHEHYVKKKQLWVDDGTQLRKDLLEERKTLLNQILTDRQFYADKITALERRVTFLEEQNHGKDERILSQQVQINEQALQLNSQKSLIEILEKEINEQRHTISATNSAQ